MPGLVSNTGTVVASMALSEEQFRDYFRSLADPQGHQPEGAPVVQSIVRKLNFDFPNVSAAEGSVLGDHLKGCSLKTLGFPLTKNFFAGVTYVTTRAGEGESVPVNRNGVVVNGDTHEGEEKVAKGTGSEEGGSKELQGVDLNTETENRRGEGLSRAVAELYFYGLLRLLQQLIEAPAEVQTELLSPYVLPHTTEHIEVPTVEVTEGVIGAEDYGEEDDDNFEWEPMDGSQSEDTHKDENSQIRQHTCGEKIIDISRQITSIGLERIDDSDWRDWKVGGCLLALAKGMECQSEQGLADEALRIYHLIGDRLATHPMAADTDIDLLANALLKPEGKGPSVPRVRLLLSLLASIPVQDEAVQSKKVRGLGYDGWLSYSRGVASALQPMASALSQIASALFTKRGPALTDAQLLTMRQDLTVAVNVLQRYIEYGPVDQVPTLLLSSGLWRDLVLIASSAASQDNTAAIHDTVALGAVKFATLADYAAKVPSLSASVSDVAFSLAHPTAYFTWALLAARTQDAVCELDSLFASLQVPPLTSHSLDDLRAYAIAATGSLHACTTLRVCLRRVTLATSARPLTVPSKAMTALRPCLMAGHEKVRGCITAGGQMKLPATSDDPQQTEGAQQELYELQHKAVALHHTRIPHLQWLHATLKTLTSNTQTPTSKAD